jgi:hypothetical protein
VHLSTVRGSVARGVASYVSLYGARYSSEVLQRSPGLVGQKIRVYIRPDDIREAWAYLPNGADFGRLLPITLKMKVRKSRSAWQRTRLPYNFKAIVFGSGKNRGVYAVAAFTMIL